MPAYAIAAAGATAGAAAGATAGAAAGSATRAGVAGLLAAFPDALVVGAVGGHLGAVRVFVSWEALVATLNAWTLGAASISLTD